MGSTSIPEKFFDNLADEAKNKSPIIPLPLFELLNQYGSKVKRSRDEDEPLSTDSGANPVSTNTALINLAKQQLLQSKITKVEDICKIASGFGPQSKDMELAMLIQSAAVKVANGKYLQASKLLARCDQFSCRNGTPFQRLVYYFSEALQMKIDREWGSFCPYQLESTKVRTLPIDVEQAQYHLHPVIAAAQQEEAFTTIVHLVASGTIMDSVSSAKRVHLIDFGIENGSHWTPLMQSLATRSNEDPFEQLKITAVGSSKEILEGIGKSLSSFAETIDLTFEFNIVVSDLKDIKDHLFDVKADEAVAVYSGMRLSTLLRWPNDLQNVIKVIRKLKPCLVVVKEMEARTNSPIFLERFNEAFLLFSTLFDSINGCLSHHILYRKLTEEVIFRDRIINTITAEGGERIFRYENIAFWRSLFGRFGIVETRLSSSSLSAANWLLGRSPHLFRTLDVDGKCLIMGWKKCPIISLSAWKFLPQI